MDCRACSPCFSTNWGHREEMKSLIIHLRRNEITVSLKSSVVQGPPNRDPMSACPPPLYTPLVACITSRTHIELYIECGQESQRRFNVFIRFTRRHWTESHNRAVECRGRGERRRGKWPRASTGCLYEGRIPMEIICVERRLCVGACGQGVSQELATGIH